MESDFITRQHLDSLTPEPDPSLAEVMNNYKFPPQSSPSPQPMTGFNGYPPYFGGPPMASSNNDMLLGNILGQLQANQNKSSNLDGFQLNINMKVLVWILIILLLAVLVWLALKVQQNRKNPLKRRLKKLEKQFKRMRRFKRKNPKALESQDLGEIEDAFDELDDDDF